MSLFLVFCLILTSNKAIGNNATENATCGYTFAEYQPFVSRVTMPDSGEGKTMGWKGQIIGVNSTGTIYLIGGVYQFEWDDCGYCYSPEPNRFTLRINIYDEDTYLAFDEDAMPYNYSVQEAAWEHIKFNAEAPVISKPQNSFGYYTANFGETFNYQIYCTFPCSTQLKDDDILYIFNPYVTSKSYSEQWPVLIKYDMSGDGEFLPDTNYTKDIPSDVIDTYFQGYGCTTNNGTHIFHFNLIRNGSQYLSVTVIYEPDTDEWSLAAANPYVRFSVGCSADKSYGGKYIYLIGGATCSSVYWCGAIIPTDRYNIFDNSWDRLQDSANYPHWLGRKMPVCFLDTTTKQIAVFGGYRYDKNVRYPINGIDIFYLKNESWRIVTADNPGIYMPKPAASVSVLKIENYAPNRDNENYANYKADIMFLFGGGAYSAYDSKIQFLSVLSDQEIYTNGKHYIEMEDPEDLSDVRFDAYQRFELKFRVITTEEAEYIIDESWNYEFFINGLSLQEINEFYDTSLQTRDLEYFNQSDCEVLSKNVVQKVVAQLMIPSKRTLHNGYCADHDLDWLFKPGISSEIEFVVSSSDGQYNHSQIFTLNFADFGNAMISQNIVWRQFYNITGWEDMNQTDRIEARTMEHECNIVKLSNGILTNFEIQCSGFEFCDGNLYQDVRQNAGLEECGAKIEYNILMNDVLVAPHNWVRQDYLTDSITVTEGLKSDSLIALIRAETKTYTWFQECFFSDTFNFQEEWLTIQQVLETYNIDDLWENITEKIMSNKNEDIIAAFSIIEELIESNISLPDGADAVELVVQKLNNITHDMMVDKKTLDDITTDVALIELLTSNPNLVVADIIANISNEWLPIILDRSLQIIEEENAYGGNANNADLVQTIGTIAGNAADNLITIANETDELTQDLLETLQNIMLYTLQWSWENETIIHERWHTTTYGQKIDLNNETETECSYGSFAVTIPPNYGQNMQRITCIITLVDDNTSNVVNLFDENSVSVYATADECFPYLLTMTVVGTDAETTINHFTNFSDDNDNSAAIMYPKCIFWDVENDEWDGKGCVVYNYTSTHVTCACTHLTSFSISSESFDPKANVLQANDFRFLTGTNLQSYPATWVTMLLIFIILTMSCICVPNNNADKPIIAFEDIIYKEFRDQHLPSHQQWYEIQQIDRWYSKIAKIKHELQSADIYNSGDTIHTNKRKKHASKYYALLSTNLFKTYLKNDHTVASVFQRTDGTNFSTKQRLGLFLLYIYCIMMATAIFYGRERKPMGDLTASALISLIGTCPVFLIRILFQWAKPRVIPSVNYQIISSNEAETETQDDSEEIIKNILKSSSRPDMKLVRKCMTYVKENPNTSMQSKTDLAKGIRTILFNYNYPFPHWVKKLAWLLLILICILCGILSVLYGVQFDIASEKIDVFNDNKLYLENEVNSVENEYGNGKCWYISNKLMIERELYKDEILKQQSMQNELVANQEADTYTTDFNANVYDSTKWLLNVLISFLTSVFIWQPLTIYILTWFKIWAFHNGLVMEASMYNMYQFMCCCCVKWQKRKNLDIDNMERHITDQAEHQNNINCVSDSESSFELSINSTSGSGFSAVTNNDRELDVIGFLCNDELFIHLPDKSNSFMD